MMGGQSAEKIRTIIKLTQKSTDKSVSVYSVRKCPQYTEVMLVGEDTKGRKFCRIIPCKKEL